MPPAGNACFRLHSEMRKRGIESSVLTIKQSIKRNYVYNLKRGVIPLLKEVLGFLYGKYVKRLLLPSAYIYSYKPFTGAIVHKEPIVQNADVIYLHWIAGGCMTFGEIEKIIQLGKPVIFFMHDMWDFTGGCHHSFDCKEFETGCRNCKMFVRNSNMPSYHLMAKKKLYSKYSNIVFISPSLWMEEKAKRSIALQGKNVISISNVVDECNFKPLDKKIAREILNLPQNKTIISFGCQAGTTNQYKGWSYLKEAIDHLEIDNIHVLIYGSDFNKTTQDQVKYPITFLGPILDETKLSLICNASDVFVSPSLAESFGLTFLENILCGTPVVGFDNTAVGEIVISGNTGYLADNRNPEDLAKGIESILNKKTPLLFKYDYSTDDVIKKHVVLMESLLNKTNEK